MNIYKFSPSPKTKANAISAIEWQNIFSWWKWPPMRVVICWKIRIFAYWTTPSVRQSHTADGLWFAEKFVSLLIEQHQGKGINWITFVVICWKIRIFAYWTTPRKMLIIIGKRLWFAEKFVSLLIEQHQERMPSVGSNVVICWKIRIFAYWTTPLTQPILHTSQLWFAEKFVSLLIEQHRDEAAKYMGVCCDLLKNSYLCLLNNTVQEYNQSWIQLWFAEKFVSLLIEQHQKNYLWVTTKGCDLLKNSYLCLLNNTHIENH